MQRTVRTYRKNSPEALARAVFMMMITDGKLGEAELSALDRLDAFTLLRIDRAGFARVASEYCRDLLAAAEQTGRVRLVDVERIDAVLDAVDDPGKRLVVCALILNLGAADDLMQPVELELLRYVLSRWDLLDADLPDRIANAATPGLLRQAA